MATERPSFKQITSLFGKFVRYWERIPIVRWSSVWPSVSRVQMCIPSLTGNWLQRLPWDHILSFPKPCCDANRRGGSRD